MSGSPAADKPQVAPPPPASAYLLVTAALKPEHDLTLRMPATVDEFVDALTSGDRPCFTGANDAGLTCTPAQRALLTPLIAAFNAASSGLGRVELLNKFMVEAAAAEKAAGAQTVDGVSYRIGDYQMQAASGEAPAGTVLFVEDYPDGPQAHGKTLAVGVMRWARFVANLVDLKVETFPNAAARDEALRARKLVSF